MQLPLEIILHQLTLCLVHCRLPSPTFSCCFCLSHRRLGRWRCNHSGEKQDYACTKSRHHCASDLPLLGDSRWEWRICVGGGCVPGIPATTPLLPCESGRLARADCWARVVPQVGIWISIQRLPGGATQDKTVTYSRRKTGRSNEGSVIKTTNSASLFVTLCPRPENPYLSNASFETDGFILNCLALIDIFGKVVRRAICHLSHTNTSKPDLNRVPTQMNYTPRNQYHHRFKARQFCLYAKHIYVYGYFIKTK